MALLLLCVSVCFYLASGTFLDFRLDTVDPNELILECYDADSGIIDSGATIDFFFPGVSAPHRSSPTGSSNTGLLHTVTPANEALLRCTASDGSGMSEQVAIAGIYVRNSDYYSDSILANKLYTSCALVTQCYSSSVVIWT